MSENIETRLLRLETDLHRREVRRSPERLLHYLAPDFIEFGSSGRVFDRTAIIAALQAARHDAEITVSDFQVRTVAADTALVTYVSHARSAEGVFATRRSSLWQLQGADWCMVFHQGTPMT